MADTNASDTQVQADLKNGWGDVDDILRNFQKAVDEAIAEHRRHGRLIATTAGQTGGEAPGSTRKGEKCNWWSWVVLC